MTDYLPLLLFIGVLIAERAFPIPAHIHPFVVLRQIAIALARRVHPSDKRPRTQQRISGLMALAMLLLLWVTPVALFYAFAELKQWFAAIILWLCLPSQPWLREAKLIQKALQQGQKLLARARLKRWLNRDVEVLSALGIEKAACEQCVQRQLQAWVGVTFWFVIAGPIAALVYRLCFELARAWPTSFSNWRDFGAANQSLFALFNWPPYLMMLALLAIMSLFTGKYKQTLHFPHLKDHEQQLYFSLTRVFALELGGPVKYQGVKISRPRFIHPQRPTSGLIQHTILRLSMLQFIFALIAVALLALRAL